MSALLGAYRGAMATLEPLADLHLRRRLARGKEDPLRYREKLGVDDAPPPGRFFWIHAASVGESLSILPLIAPLRRMAQGCSALVTTGTPTSAALMARRLPDGALHRYAPLDAPRALRRFLDRWRPIFALRVESEIWPGTITALAERGAPQALINGRMSERSFRTWRRAPATAKALFGRFAPCLAQSEDDAERLRTLGATGARSVGNLKHAAPPLPHERAALDTARARLGERPIWVAASTHPGEEEKIAAAHAQILKTRPDAYLVLVPRHPDRGPAIASMLDARFARFETARQSAGASVGEGGALFVADAIGELGLHFRLSQFAFLGGSLIPHGGQNPLEAARLARPTVFGPHMENFPAIAPALVETGAAIEVADERALAALALALFEDPALRHRMGAAGEAAARAEAQALNRTLDALEPMVARALLESALA